MSKLVIVESPAKARTIEKYLGPGYKVAASVGHVVDLPKKELGVDIAKDFTPKYEVMAEKKQAVANLKKAAKEAEMIYLAPDPDREGEAIAWHIADLLRNLGKPMRRVMINEITKPAVIEAIKNAGELDKNRYDAQQARRVLDRLVGYQISPLLSRKFRSNLSAGRVQSVALRLVVERERAIRAFRADEYWTIEAALSAKLPPAFKARLVAIGDKSLETPSEKFDEKKKTYIKDEAQAKSILAALAGKPFIVDDVVRQERRRNPLPPFITSTLQQEAARKLGFAAKKTMLLAQRLYEGQDVGEGAVGLITYMRTDSPRVAEQAIAMVRDYIGKNFGPDFLPDSPRFYKSRKLAQEAHEAIRPTAMERTPEQAKKFLDPDMARLYELIYLRFTASQMNPAVYDQTTVEIPVDNYRFRAGGRVLKFKGFLAVYEESVEDEVDTGEDAGALPPLAKGDALQNTGFLPEQHFTKPPPRFTEASLVKELEERGIGRPSTYAQILSTLQDRKYVEKQSNRFFTTPLGERVTDALIETFPKVMEISFTAQMEEDLDKVEDGQENWIALMHRFYTPFAESLAGAGDKLSAMSQEAPTDIPCPTCGKELMIKWSKKGEFIGCSTYPECKFTSDFDRDEEGNIHIREKVALEIMCPECGKPLTLRKGRAGEFAGCTGYPECKFTANFTKDENGVIALVVRTEEATGIACDKCGKPMVIRRTRRGGREFLACTGYPDCKNAKDFSRKEDGSIEILKPGDEGEECPTCGKPMTLKRGRFGSFWACTGYPECKQTKPAGGRTAPTPAAGAGAAAPKPASVPLPDEPACEKCGRPMVQRQGRFGPFTACSGYPECKNIRKKKPAGGAKKKAEPKAKKAKKEE